MINKDNEKKENLNYLPSKMMLMVRILLGGYLIYTAYELTDAIVKGEATNKLFNIAFAIIFILAGVVMLFFSIKSFKTGKYIGGIMDQSLEENVIEENVIEEDVIEEDTSIK